MTERISITELGVNLTELSKITTDTGSEENEDRSKEVPIPTEVIINTQELLNDVKKKIENNPT